MIHLTLCDKVHWVLWAILHFIDRSVLWKLVFYRLVCIITNLQDKDLKFSSLIFGINHKNPSTHMTSQRRHRFGKIHWLFSTSLWRRSDVADSSKFIGHFWPICDVADSSKFICLFSINLRRHSDVADSSKFIGHFWLRFVEIRRRPMTKIQRRSDFVATSCAHWDENFMTVSKSFTLFRKN